MEIHSLPVLIMCGISCYAGLSRLMMFILRKESRVNLYFSLVCFSIAFYDAMCVGLYNSDAVEAGVLWQRSQFIAAAFLGGSFLYFIFSLYEKPATVFKRLYIVILSALIVLGLAFPDLVVSAQTPNVRSFDFLGIRITYFEGSTGLIFNLLYLWLVIGMGYFFKIAVPTLRQRHRDGAVYLLAGMSLFLVGSFLDILIGSNLVTLPYSTEYSVLALILMMDLALQRRLGSLLGEVNTLNATLEEKVASRTEEISRLVGELSSRNKVLADLADRDGLTRLLNHAAFHRRLAEELNASRRQSFPLALVMLDIDLFKEINDSYGHQVGDRVLLKIAEVLTHSSRDYDSKSRYEEPSQADGIAPGIRDYDVPGRYGGDEFAVLLPYCREPELLIIAERIRKRIEGIQIPGFPELRISASLGCAIFDPAESGEKTGTDVMQEADGALYDAKAAGRGRTVIASRGNVA